MGFFLRSVFCALLVAAASTPILSQFIGTCRCQNNGICLVDVSGAGIQCLCQEGYNGIICENRDVSLIENSTPPTVFNCPADFEARRQPSENAVFITWEEPYATDSSGQAPSVMRNIAPNFFAVSNYDFEVIYRYTDQEGLSTDCRFTVTVIYSEEVPAAPSFTGCPDNITVIVTQGISSVVSWTEPTAVPVGQEVIVVEKSRAPGTEFFLGRTTVTYTFSSPATQVQSLCTFIVTVLSDSCQCDNGGLCIPNSDMTGIRCQCPLGFNGILCKQQDNCQCQNNGVCQYDAQGIGIQCLCPIGFQGLLCEGKTNQGQCGCGNGGTCLGDVSVPGGIMCLCPPEFTGILCETSTASDTEAPMITSCPDDIIERPTVSSGQVYITWPEPQAVDNSGIAPSVSQNVPTGIYMNISDVQVVIYNFTDDAGNLAVCQFTVSVLDETPPVITYCPPDIKEMAPAKDAMMFVTWAKPEASDNSGKVVKMQASAEPGIFVMAGNALSVSYVFTDESGNQATCNFTIVIDAPDPTQVPDIEGCPSDVALNVTHPSNMATGFWVEPTASIGPDNVPVYQQSHQSGSSFQMGTTLVTYVFRDERGNEGLCSFMVTVTVIGGEVVTPESPVSVGIVNITATSARVIWMGPNSAFDSFRISISSPSSTTINFADKSQMSLELFALMPDTNYTMEVSSVIGTDPSSLVISTPAVVSFKTEAVDTTPPVISDCPSNITLPVGQSVANWKEPTAVDDSNLTPLVSKSHEPGAVFVNESTVVTYTFTDAAGNVAECVFTVSRTPVVIPESPASISVANITATSARVIWMGPTSALDSFRVSISSPSATTIIFADKSQTSLELFALMPDTNYTVEVSSVIGTDPNSLVISTPAVVSFKTEAVDTTPPVISDCPSNITLPVGQSVANWTEPTAVDDSNLTPLVSKSHEPGAVFVNESTVVTYTFTDAAGNVAQCVFTVSRTPVVTPESPVSISVANITATSARVIWMGPTSTLDSFRVSISSPSAMTIIFADKSQMSLELFALMPDTNYTVEVSSVIGTDPNSLVISTPAVVSFKTEAVDTTPPVISDCPSNITLPVGQTVANWTEPTAVDDSNLTLLVSKSHEPGAVFVNESTVVTYTFTDATGNVAQCVFTVSRILVLDPPTSLSVVNVSTEGAFLSWTPPNATFDVYVVLAQGFNFSMQWILPSLQDSLQLVLLDPSSNYTLSVSTAVAYGTENLVFSAPVTVSFATPDEPDTTPPVISDCPSNIILPVSQSMANWTEPTAVDDSNLTPLVSKSHEPGAVFVNESTVVTYTFTDAAGNVAQCVFTVSRTPDSTAPVISDCPSDILLPLDETVGNWTQPTATDDSGNLPSVVTSRESGTSFPEGNTTVMYKFTDYAGNQANCSFVVTVTLAPPVDSTAPVISDCPSDILLPLDETVATWTQPTATDDSGNLPSVVTSREPGTSFPEGNTTVMYTFTDDAGNQANCSFVVTVTLAPPVDSTAPVISDCPSDILLPLDETVATWTQPTATDDSGNSPSVIASHEPGTSFPEGNTTVTYRFFDDSGNPNTCSFVVTVTPDTLAPVITDCPADIMLPFASTLANWTEPSATDNSGQPPIVTKTHEPGTNFGDGSTTVAYTFTDPAGNRANCSFVVRVIVDDVAPVVLSCPSNVTIPFGNDTATWSQPTATDNSGQAPNVAASHQAGAVFPEGTTMVTYTFMDASGNQANCVFFVIRLTDVTPPVISGCTPIIDVSPGTNLASWDEPTATDNSGQELAVTKSHEPNSVFTDNVTMVIYTFTDAAGNEANCVFFVKLAPVDDIPPVISDCPSDLDIILPLAQQSDRVVSWTEPTATDNSGVAPSVNQTHRPGDGFPEGRTTVSYTFTDGSGLTEVCSFIIDVQREEDVTPPVFFNCPASQAYVIPAENQFMIVMWNPPTALDDSGVDPVIVSSRNPGEVFSLGTTTVVYTFTDPSGNQAQCEFNITLSHPVLSPCQTMPCRPNESCFYSADDYICVPGPFRKRREIINGDAASSCACMNGGRCQQDEGVEGIRCICQTGFAGILCQEGAEVEESVSYSPWQPLLLAGLFILSLLAVLLLALYNCTRRRGGKSGYDLPPFTL